MKFHLATLSLVSITFGASILQNLIELPSQLTTGFIQFQNSQDKLLSLHKSLVEINSVTGDGKSFSIIIIRTILITFRT